MHEICIFSYLASELKTDDVCVEGSDDFADYRSQLLTWQQCQSELESYCEELNFSSTPEQFVLCLQEHLTQVARSADEICQQGDSVTMSDDGKPVLKRIQAEAKSTETAAKRKIDSRADAGVGHSRHSSQRRTLAAFFAAFWNAFWL